MSTNGFISFVAQGEAKNAYNHWDSGPEDLGINVLNWLRAAIATPEVLKAAIVALKVVDNEESPDPTPAEVRELSRYSDRSVGNPSQSWYALLRGTQGDPVKILASGYIISEEPDGWTYQVDTDQQTFSVKYADLNLTWPWSALPADEEFLTETEPWTGS